MLFRSGLVMHSTTVYSIFWIPSGYTVDGTYKSLIDQYLADVSAVNGSTGNVFSTTPQYTDGTGNAAYDLHVGGSVIDTTAFPTNDCLTTPANYIPTKVTTCVTDTQIINEIRSVMAAQSWTASESKLFVLFTPRNVGSCVSSASSQCAFTTFCGYHSDDVGHLLYSYMPYDAWSNSCNVGQLPNAGDADATINVLSHELNEAITDPHGDAWYDSNGD
mgnify:FL=1